MQYITTTDLRTKSSELIKTLEKGNSVSLIHRSKVVGTIEPAQDKPIYKVFNAKKFKEHVKKLNFPKTSYKEREKIYRKHLMEKYGKYVKDIS